MCQFGIIYYHFFQRRQTYIRQFFLLHRLYSIYLHIRQPPPIVTLTALNFSSLCLYTKFFFPEKSSSYISNGVSSSPFILSGLPEYPDWNNSNISLFPDLQISPARFFYSAAKGDFKTSLLSSCVLYFKTQFKL